MENKDGVLVNADSGYLQEATPWVARTVYKLPLGAPLKSVEPLPSKRTPAPT